ncbi:MAG: hypothetical protein IPK86_04235 [Neisseriales bacterium]|nr:MAG: hypothetical protein IPK86_04235 [Neisseriales bacterium]
MNKALNVIAIATSAVIAVAGTLGMYIIYKGRIPSGVEWREYEENLYRNLYTWNYNLEDHTYTFMGSKLDLLLDGYLKHAYSLIESPMFLVCGVILIAALVLLVVFIAQYILDKLAQPKDNHENHAD